MLNKLKDKIQKEALKAWKDAGKCHTVEIATGVGKTFTAFHAIYTMRKGGKVLILAETAVREDTIKEDADKYESIFGKNPFTDYKITFMCYQSAYKLSKTKWSIVVADEIHDSLTPSYSKFYENNEYKALIGLSATIDRKTTYEIEEEETIIEFTKGELLDMIAPVCYRYTINQGQIDGASRKLRIYVVNHQMDFVTKSIEGGNKQNRFMQTEESAYAYWDSVFRKAIFTNNKHAISNASRRRADILYKLPSKIKATKKLVENIKGRTIVFGNSIDAVLQVTENTVSSRNSEKVNKQMLSGFQSGDIDIIGSFKMLKQGANLNGLKNAVIMSYYSKSKDLIQRLGRLRVDGTIGNIFIFRTSNTQEMKWYNKMFEDIDEFDFIECQGINQCIKKYLEYEATTKEQ